MAGVAPPRRNAYLGGMAIFPRPVSPFRAIRDLRVFLAQRQKHELVFAFLSVFLTVMLIAGFYVDSSFKTPWKRKIQYVESWPLDRSLAQIKAQQKIDQAAKKIREAELEKRRQEKMAQFKKLDKKLDDLGF